MIDFKNIEVLNSSICPLKETSKDNNDGADFYMTNSMLNVVNFDMAKDKYIKGLKISETAKSIDALYVSNDGDMYFIEFKNGKVNSDEKRRVKLKILSSLLILTDIVDASISYTRQNLSYILVYNETKNPRKTKNNDSQGSPSRTEIGEYFMKKGKEKYIRFGFGRFKNLYFKDVFTVTEEKFENDFVKNWLSH